MTFKDKPTLGKIFVWSQTNIFPSVGLSLNVVYYIISSRESGHVGLAESARNVIHTI